MNLKVGDLEGDELIYRDMQARYGIYFKGAMGAPLFRSACRPSTSKLKRKLRETINTGTGQRKTRALKRLKVVNAFLNGQRARSNGSGRHPGDPARPSPDGAALMVAALRPPTSMICTDALSTVTTV